MTQDEINARLKELRQHEHALRSHEAYCNGNHLLHGDILEELSGIHRERVQLTAELDELEKEED